MGKRILSLLLVLTLCSGVSPFGALASEEPDSQAAAAEEIPGDQAAEETETAGSPAEMTEGLPEETGEPDYNDAAGEEAVSAEGTDAPAAESTGESHAPGPYAPGSDEGPGEEKNAPDGPEAPVPDGAAENPAYLRLGDTEVNCTGEILYYQFVPDADGTYSFYTSGSADTLAYLYDADGNLIASDDDSGNSYNFRLEQPMEKGSVYYLAVGTYRNTAANFTLTVNYCPSLAYMESNSADLGVGDTEAAFTGESLCYRFVPDADGTCVFHTSGSARTVGCLYDADGNQIAYSNTSGGSRNFRIEQTLEGGAVYYLVVRTYDYAAASFTLTVEYYPSEAYLSAETDTVAVGYTLQIRLYHPQGGSDIVWRSSDSSVAVVNEDGLVYGTGAGTAVITVSGDSFSLTQEIRVTGSAPSLSGYSFSALDNGELDYTGGDAMQIVSEPLRGLYFWDGQQLSFYSLASGLCVPVKTFSRCISAYEADNKLYVLVSRTECRVLDLTSWQETSVTLDSGMDTATAVGADAKGRIYVAGYSYTDDGTVYSVSLYSTGGTLLSQMGTDAQVYSFNGFDSVTGNFFMESYYNWVYWGYDHPGHGVTMGNVTGDTLSGISTSSSVLVSGLLTYDLSCIEYLCQNWYYLHQKGADLIGGRYLVTASTTYGRVLVMDTRGGDLDVLLEFDREGVETAQDDDHYDTGSIGVRAVYNADHDSVIIYENDHQLTEYSLGTGEKLNSFETKYNVFNLLMEGDRVYIIEKEDGDYYLETVDWSDPTAISIRAAKTTLAVGETETLTVTAEDKAFTMLYDWQSSDSSVVSVTSAGRIAAWSEGTAVITAASQDGKLKASITVTVSPAQETELKTSQILSGGVISDNVSDNNYSVYHSSTVNSAIYENSAGNLVRVEYTGSGVTVEEWSKDGALLSSRTLEAELPLYGGFYHGEEYNFLVFGQANPEESDSCEVLRIVKYSSDWERLDACPVYGANTYIPFDAGSLRMTETGGSLYVYTCHEMYADDYTGLHHQANMTFVIDEAAMAVEQSYYDVMNIAQAGYVSHSFNQFIQTDGTYVYRVDHGDANPRAVSVTRCSADGSITDVSYTYALGIQGSSGANATGVSVGGFELSSDNCIIAGNSVDQSDADTYSASGQRNIFVTVTDKKLTGTEVVWLTDYSSADHITPRTPQLVKLNDEQFLVLWEEYNTQTCEVTVKAAGITADGEVVFTSDLSARLSDCQPVFTSDGTVCWYVTDGGSATLYSIDPWDPYVEPAYTPGDINGDGAVNISDVQALLKYVNGQNVTVITAACDTNGDSAVNISDVQILLKYVNGQNVTIR